MDLKEKTKSMKNWAVVGATQKKYRFGYKIVKKLRDKGYNVFPVNPKLDEVAGIKCFSSIKKIDQEIDVVDLVVNPEIGLKIMKDIDELGIKYVWLQPGARSDEIREFASEKGINLIEDCIYAALD